MRAADFAARLAEDFHVVELYPLSNRPFRRDWQKKRHTPLSAHAAWEDWPAMNIGVVAWPNYWVLDLDGPEATSWYAALAHQRGHDPFATLTITTPGRQGGRHLWWLMPKLPDSAVLRSSMRGNRQAEIKCGPGRQTAFPPSVRPEGRYSFEDDGWNSPQTTPQWMLEYIVRERESAPVHDLGMLAQDDSEWGHAAALALEAAVESIAQCVERERETRNNVLFWGACRLTARCARRALPDAPRRRSANGTRGRRGRPDDRLGTKEQSMTSLFASNQDVHDVGMARLFVAEHGHGFRHIAKLGWFTWTGKLFEACEEDLVYDTVREYNKKIVQFHLLEADIIKRLLPYLQATAISRVLRIARAMQPIRVDNVSDFDSDPDLLNVQNGVLDLRLGTVVPHDPSFMMTKICAAAYEPDARHQDVDKVLEVIADGSTRNWFQCVLGSACSGRTPADDLSVILDGPGSNGKSTLLGMAMGALGTYAEVIADSVLTSRQDHPTGLADFRGLRLAVVDETPELGRLNIQVVKRLSSGNEVRARRMREDYFSFMPTHTLIIATNHRPVVTETDRGTWRRLSLTPFPFSYGHKSGDLPPDPGLRDRVRDSPDKQAGAALAWMVTDTVRWYRNQRLLTPLPAAVEQATAAWRNEVDVLSQFAEDRLNFEASKKTTKADLFVDYQSWAMQNGITNFQSARAFDMALLAHELGTKNGLKVSRSGGTNYWTGVGLKARTLLY